eukprot:TRINITY_DN11037_c0_g1_i1.p1 TRINITY_DN11037_c0_g1~~TRINITY_DN11037_c0_g1_i1.p1  ORF type:complete len:111 (-),score=19.55 TRINITY_DN11037_c0_g1_i1:209-541(-)
MRADTSFPGEIYLDQEKVFWKSLFTLRPGLDFLSGSSKYITSYTLAGFFRTFRDLGFGNDPDILKDLGGMFMFKGKDRCLFAHYAKRSTHHADLKAVFATAGLGIHDTVA